MFNFFVDKFSQFSSFFIEILDFKRRNRLKNCGGVFRIFEKQKRQIYWHFVSGFFGFKRFCLWWFGKSMKKATNLTMLCVGIVLVALALLQWQIVTIRQQVLMTSTRCMFSFINSWCNWLQMISMWRGEEGRWFLLLLTFICVLPSETDIYLFQHEKCNCDGNSHYESY